MSATDSKLFCIKNMTCKLYINNLCDLCEAHRNENYVALYKDTNYYNNNYIIYMRGLIHDTRDVLSLIYT